MCMYRAHMHPTIQGITATRQIRANNYAPDICIIAMTANAMESDMKLCLQAG